MTVIKKQTELVMFTLVRVELSTAVVFQTVFYRYTVNYQMCQFLWLYGLLIWSALRSNWCPRRRLF
jgi:hypothetical protein